MNKFSVMALIFVFNIPTVFAEAGPFVDHFEISGLAGKDPKHVIPNVHVDGDSIQLGIDPGPAAETKLNDGARSGFSASYSCVSYEIRVGSYAVRTPVMAVNGGSQFCQGAPKSAKLLIPMRDLKKADIIVSNPFYDFKAQLCARGLPCQPGSAREIALQPAYKGHQFTGTIVIENFHYGRPASPAQGNAGSLANAAH